MSKKDWKDFFYLFVFIPVALALYAYSLSWFIYIVHSVLPWPTLISGV